MKMNQALLILLFSLSASCISAQVLTAIDIIEKSIQYHDPSDVLAKKATTLHLIETRPNGTDRKTMLNWNLKKNEFQMISNRDSLTIQSSWKNGVVAHTVNGKDEFSKEIKDTYRLTDDRVSMMKDYYQYLWLMPMKLQDPGTIIEPEARIVDFFGDIYLEVKVTYTPEVGTDIWYFYFHPKTFALSGYRFYHDEAANDGEYILFDGEVSYQGVKLPRERKWYTHKEDKFLGADVLSKLKF